MKYILLWETKSTAGEFRSNMITEFEGEPSELGEYIKARAEDLKVLNLVGKVKQIIPPVLDTETVAEMMKTALVEALETIFPKTAEN